MVSPSEKVKLPPSRVCIVICRDGGACPEVAPQKKIDHARELAKQLDDERLCEKSPHRAYPYGRIRRPASKGGTGHFTSPRTWKVLEAVANGIGFSNDVGRAAGITPEQAADKLFALNRGGYVKVSARYKNAHVYTITPLGRKALKGKKRARGT